MSNRQQNQDHFLYPANWYIILCAIKVLLYLWCNTHAQQCLLNSGRLSIDSTVDQHYNGIWSIEEENHSHIMHPRNLTQVQKTSLFGWEKNYAQSLNSAQCNPETFVHTKSWIHRLASLWHAVPAVDLLLVSQQDSCLGYCIIWIQPLYIPNSKPAFPWYLWITNWINSLLNTCIIQLYTYTKRGQLPKRNWGFGYNYNTKP